MCGIAGKLSLAVDRSVDRSEITAMLMPIHHRGPDAQGVYLDGGVGLGHARLSIIDVACGVQPMANEDETVWIVFNGEIYNFETLRDELIAKGHTFRNRSDTEVIVHLYEEYGVDCVHHLQGMFAFAIWDKKRQRLFIARDRVGIKPLYFCQAGDNFWFASEMKAILADSDVPRRFNHDALRRFLSFYYVPGKITLFRDIHKLLPGHTLTVEEGRIKIHRYWDLKFTDHRFNCSFDDVVDELYNLLRSTVRDHMIADVPVGVLLSGGVDSSAVLNLAVRETNKKVKTFTVGFDGHDVVDERPFARLAAAEFGTDHHELTLNAEDFWNFLPSYVWHMEEPVCEPPAVALYFISRLARQHVKVLLSGEGGDEAFAGYPNYPQMLRIGAISNALGPLARPAGAAATILGRLLGDDRVIRYGSAMGASLSNYFSRVSGPTLGFNGALNTLLASGFRDQTAHESSTAFVADLLDRAGEPGLLNKMLYIDTMTWLPDDLLIKADKMTMANSVELRVPLLDHKVLEFAASLPPNYKTRGRETKRALKAAFAKVLPPEVLNRKKAGFPVPYSRWLTNDLQSQVQDVLLSKSAKTADIFNRVEMEKLLGKKVVTNPEAKAVFSSLVVELWFGKFSAPTPEPLPAELAS
jgi:asparagine synthase (glutamine-hydrolysing)